jgi:hypothetical protein
MPGPPGAGPAAGDDLHRWLDQTLTKLSRKSDKAERWLARHKRFHIHFTPTSASWLNMIERE